MVVDKSKVKTSLWYLKVARATTKDRLNLPAWIKTLLLLKIKTKCATTCKALYNLISMLCAFYKIDMSHIFVRDLVIISLGDDRPEEEQEWISLQYRSEGRRQGLCTVFGGCLTLSAFLANSKAFFIYTTKPNASWIWAKW